MTIDSIPSGPIDAPSAWVGEDLAKTPKVWLTALDEAEITELETAAKAYLATGRDIGQITQADFPLPVLGGRLQGLRETLTSGRGFEVLRGLPVDRYDQETAATIFCGLGAHLGSVCSQNAAGHTLGHVRDVGADATDPNTRIYQTHERQTFHTDSADVVGLLCLREAQSGGESLLVSTATVFNTMLMVRPDLVPLLFEPIATDRRGEVPEGCNPWFDIPVLSWFEGHLTGMYQRQYIESAQRFPEAPRLTPKHIETLNLFDATANHPRNVIRMRLQPGDIQFVHNHALMHDRTNFVDWPDPARRRHLLRLWLSVPGDRPLPDVFAQRFGSTAIGDRGGIFVPGTTQNAPIDN